MALPQAHNLLEINIDSPVKAVRDRGGKRNGDKYSLPHHRARPSYKYPSVTKESDHSFNPFTFLRYTANSNV